jgi:hypothetical protein
MRTTVAVLAALALGGCATTFYGDAKVKGGPRGCWDWCRAQGMELAGMVKMGEYSDGCICQAPTASPAEPVGPRSEGALPPGVDGPAVAGVWSQMQAAAAQQMHAAAAAAAHQSAANRHSASQHRGFGGYRGSGRF